MKKMHSINRRVSRTIVAIIIALVASTVFTTVLYLDSRSQYEILNQRYSLLQSQFNTLQENYSLLKNSYTSLNEKYVFLESNFNTLQTNYNNLRTDYEHLSLEYNRLRDNYSTLKSSYDQLTLQYNKLNDDYSSLNYSYINLKSDYSILISQYNSLQYTLKTWEQLHIGTTLATYYDYVRANIVTIGGYPLAEEKWWVFPSYYKMSATFAAEIAAHDAGQIYWPGLENGSHYYDYTGEYSYQTAKRILSQALLLAGVKPGDDNVTKIDKIMNFTNSIVHYEHRLIDHMWFPTETLTFRSGDCTSFSILEAALFEMVGIKSAIGLFVNSQGEGHAMILAHLDSLGKYEYYYYPDLTSFGLSPGQWIIIEPQYNSIYQQQLYQDKWISQWKLVAAAEVPYGP